MNRFRLPSVLAALVTGLVVLFGSASPASAHNALDSTVPTDGAQLDAVPAAVILAFNEPAIALGTQLVITGPNGPVQQGDPQLVDNTVRQTVAPGSPAGAYTVVWRVTSADGHPISGTLSFTAGQASSATSAAASATPTPVATAPRSSDPNRGRIPGWLWIAAGVVVIIFARPIAARFQRRNP